MTAVQMVAFVMILSFIGSAAGAATGWMIWQSLPLGDMLQLQGIMIGMSLNGFTMGFILGCVVLVAMALRDRGR